MADDAEGEPETLDYGVEQRKPLRRRDSAEYYRELPALSRVTTGDVLIWIISFLVVVFLLLWLVGRWWAAWK